MGTVILAGDIGGTKTHLALFEKGEVRDSIVDAKYKSADYGNLIDIVALFLQENPGYSIQKACFGIAGPVKDGVCKATNLPWIVEAQKIEERVEGARVTLLNDLEANAYGIECLVEDEFFTLSKGKEERGNRALISAGTGLGEAGLFWDGEKHTPFACEGGHCSFSPEDQIEVQLLRFLQKKYEHVSFERVLSGPAFYEIYRFLVDEGVEEECKPLPEENRAQEITERARKNRCAASVRTIEIFVGIYGSEAANLALKMFSTGGLYIGGGIAPKILNEIKEGSFMHRFISKGRFTSLLQDVPVKVILNENTAMLGAAFYASHR